MSNITKIFSFLYCLTALFLLSGCDSDNQSSSLLQLPSNDWAISQCDTVVGNDYISITTDSMQSIFKSTVDKSQSGNVSANGLVIVDNNTIFASVNKNILLSEDSGCSWRQIAELPIFITNIIRASKNDIIAYSIWHPGYYRIGKTGKISIVKTPGNINAMGIDIKNEHQISIAVNNEHTIYHSTDNGSTFTAVGVEPAKELFINYFTHFDPNNLNHIIRGTINVSNSENGAGIWITFDGGLTWTQGEGFGGILLNGFSGTISENNSNVVWVLGLDINDESYAKRKIYRSIDGGRNFQAVILGSYELELNNSVKLYSNPNNSDELVFSLSDLRFKEDRLTHIYSYNSSTQIFKTKDIPYWQIGLIESIAFNPFHSNNLFFGNSFERHDEPWNLR